jgi:hypothetical protein
MIYTQQRINCRIHPAGWVVWILIFALSMVPDRTAQADIITYQNGKVQKGITEEIPEEPGQVMVITSKGRMRIPKSRIRSLKSEPLSIGHTHIGQDHKQDENYPDAIKFLQTAVELDPGNQLAHAMLDEIQSILAEQKKMSRKDAISQIEGYQLEAQDLIEKDKFEDAKMLLENAGKLVPTEPQKDELRLLISDLYLAWAEEREDKLDWIGAEEKLTLALAANENNEVIIAKLLKLWEDNPDKREQSVIIYETMLERHPADDSLRRKIGDLYYDMGHHEDALKHYLELYRQSDTYIGSRMEDRMIKLLDRLHNQYARNKDYDQAILYFNLLTEIDPDTNPTEILFYEYLKRSSQLEPDDYAGQLELSQFAEKYHLDVKAMEGYRELVKIPATRKAASEGIQRYAQIRMNNATAQFNAANYELAKVMAQTVLDEFDDIPGMREQVAELTGQANAQIASIRRQRQDQAKDLIERGDEFYQEATFHYQNMFSTERRDLPYLYSSRNEAKKKYGLAIGSYEEAIKINPSLTRDSNSLVSVRLSDCRDRLNSLVSGGGSRPSNFGRPQNTPSRSIPSLRR